MADYILRHTEKGWEFCENDITLIEFLIEKYDGNTFLVGNRQIPKPEKTILRRVCSSEDAEVKLFREARKYCQKKYSDWGRFDRMLPERMYKDAPFNFAEEIEYAKRLQEIRAGSPFFRRTHTESPKKDPIRHK